MKQDLKTRIPVAIFYVLFIGVMTLLGLKTSVILLFLFFCLSLQEFVSISTKAPFKKNVVIYITAGIIISFVLLLWVQQFNLAYITFLSCLLFVFNIIYLIITHKSLTNTTSIFASSVIYIVLPFLVAILATIEIPYFPKALLGTFIVLWLNDAGAYFVGKAFGKHKLFESISPKKTWEGSLGGGVIGAAVALLIPSVLGIYDMSTWAILSIIIWITGTYGDLVESRWKRIHGIKDSGTIMRGHGGFLDRLDSFIYSIPFVVLYIEIIL